MAYVNVLEWKAEQVSDWLRGLDDTIYPYAHFFLNNNVTGQGLLNLTVDDLYKLHVEKLGHQEIILESLELLKNFHYSLDQENLQYVCLKLSCKARSLYNEIQMRYPGICEGKQVVTGAIMSAVGDVLDSVRVLLSWLERKPFESKEEFFKVRTTLISLSLELATNTHREAFAEQPIDVIRSCCDKLGELSDGVIQEVRDPLLLQPASLDVATVRKKADEELGVVVEGVVPGVHLVSEVNMLNPSTRIQPGDEIVQVNYQTVVGWQTKKVIHVMGENPGEVILTLKKRPKHANLLGQVYMKPFRIPSRKKSAFYFNNLPSPRTELLVVPDVSIPIKKRVDSESSADESHLSDDSDLENDEAFLPVAAAEVAGQIERGKGVSPTSSLRSVLSRPRSAPQRRATISGTLPRSRPYINVGETWDDGQQDRSLLEVSYSTISSRDSGVSTMSAKQDFQLRAKDGPAPPRPVTVTPIIHQVTSAPNLRASNMLLPSSGSVDDMEDQHSRLDNVQFRNGALNIELKSPEKMLEGDKIILKVEHKPTGEQACSRTINQQSDEAARKLIKSSSGSCLKEDVHCSTAYMNLSVQDASQAHSDIDSAQSRRLHPYVNISADLVNTNPLPKPRTPKSSIASAAGGGDASSPAAGVSSVCAGNCGTTRGRRPIPLPRRFSTAETAPTGSFCGPSHSKEHSAGAGVESTVAAANVTIAGGRDAAGVGGSHPRHLTTEGAVEPRPAPTFSSPPSSTSAPRPGAAPRQGRSSTHAQRITPTAGYKSYRRAVPDVSSVPKVSSEKVSLRERGAADADVHVYTEIGEYAQVVGTSADDGNRVNGGPPLLSRVSAAKMTRNVASRLSFDMSDSSMRLSSVSSNDSGLAGSLSPTTTLSCSSLSPSTPAPHTPLTNYQSQFRFHSPQAPNLPALPPRNQMSSSKHF